MFSHLDFLLLIQDTRDLLSTEVAVLIQASLTMVIVRVLVGAASRQFSANDPS